MKKGAETVGHVPRTMSCVCSLFLRQAGTLACEVTGDRRRSVDLPQGGLELPCLLIFTGPEELVCKVKQRVEEIRRRKSCSSNTAGSTKVMESVMPTKGEEGVVSTVVEEKDVATKMGEENVETTIELLQCGNDNPDLQPTPDCSNMLPYYKDALIMLFEEQWHEDINRISTQSSSEGRLKLYRKIKTNPTVENYVSHTRSVGERRVMVGLRTGCLPLAVETGRYTSTPFGERLCRLCDCGEVEDQVHFLIICPTLLHLRTIMFNHCTAADPNFYHYSPLVKTKFILQQYNDFIVKLILQMYLYRQSILFHS